MSVALSLTECAIESVPRFRMALIFSLLESEVHPAMAFRFRSPLCVPYCCVTLYFCKKVSGEGRREAETERVRRARPRPSGPRASWGYFIFCPVRGTAIAFELPAPPKSVAPNIPIKNIEGEKRHFFL